MVWHFPPQSLINTRLLLPPKISIVAQHSESPLRGNRQEQHQGERVGRRMRKVPSPVSSSASFNLIEFSSRLEVRGPPSQMLLRLFLCLPSRPSRSSAFQRHPTKLIVFIIIASSSLQLEVRLADHDLSVQPGAAILARFVPEVVY